MFNATRGNQMTKTYRVSYVYECPSNAGPFKGKDIFNFKPAKGDVIRAVFGLAIVKSVREVKA
jgi:endonuclease I